VEVDATGLQEGKDYIVISVGHEQYKIGDDVVAVGSPHGLVGTHTFGRVSAIRNDQGVRLIQHHADINPGNSGGPLFLKTGSDRFVWIGVNTMGGGNGLGFAIDANEALRAEYEWFPADKHGAAAVIRKMYNQPNTEVR
jgi:S1-C subfamily serine protease